MTTYEQIFENNRIWVAQKLEKDKDFFKNMAREQHPDYLYIGCSDSRVPANEIMGLDAGEVFVHRNVANVVSNSDLNVASVITYAVRYLDVKHIIVCGHYNCGGVKASLEPCDYGSLNPWLRNIRDVYRLHREELDAIEDMKKRSNRLVELNVVEQCINVIKSEVVQQSYVNKGYPVVHGWVFDLAHGVLQDLKINFEEVLSSIQHIYNQTPIDWFDESVRAKLR
ncbi:MAG: carbonic anhydrase [Microscillaceae bacterium]|nr:carbonic anhydrase [Microscillaceae bacterium]